MKNSASFRLRREFNDILVNKNVTVLFQPVISLAKGEIIGYESLGRGPKGTALHSPVNLIKIAEQENKLLELELLFLSDALEKAKKLQNKKLLFLNLDTKIIKDVNFIKRFNKLTECGISPKSVVLEITERTAVDDYKQFKRALKNYTDQGYMIAIDDVGSGYSGLKTINEIRPHFLKIDIALIQNIDKDQFKQSLVKFLVDFSQNTNIRLIAEGIETPDELKTLIRLGVEAGQGYFLQKPDPLFTSLAESTKTFIECFNKKSKQ